MRRTLFSLAACLLVLLLWAAGAQAWTEFRLSGLTPGQQYTLRLSQGGSFGQWEQDDLAKLKIKPKEVSFVATSREAALHAVLHVKADAVVGTFTPWRGVKGEVETRGYQTKIEKGVWFITYPGAPLTCTVSPNCPTEFCPPGQQCYSYMGEYYCCWLAPGRPLN